MNIAEYDRDIANSQMLDSTFEDLYLNVRRYENRLITDEELLLLPDVEPLNTHYKEWQVRKRSSQRLIDYLKNKNKPLKILEIGCGNGWLTAKLAGIPNSNVIGLDINREEISQAKRVFKRENLEFIADSFDAMMFGGEKFDIILFAASIPYFRDVEAILNNSLACLAENGEIHIIDTHFYKPAAIDDAVIRMQNYYAEMGYPEMSDHYFHYSLKDIQQYNYKVLVDPQSLIYKIGKKEPFHWIVITH